MTRRSKRGCIGDADLSPAGRARDRKIELLLIGGANETDRVPERQQVSQGGERRQMVETPMEAEHQRRVDERAVAPRDSNEGNESGSPGPNGRQENAGTAADSTRAAGRPGAEED